MELLEMLFILVVAAASAIVITQVPNLNYPASHQSIGLPPQKRYKSSMATSSDCLYIFGGFPLQFSELWAYNLLNNTWSSLPSHFPIDPLASCSLFLSQSLNSLIVFGGVSETGLKNALNRYDLKQKTVLPT